MSRTKLKYWRGDCAFLPDLKDGVSSAKNLMKGDHIRVLRYGMFYHHAIDIGNGKVIQYRGEIIRGKDPTQSTVGINSASEFLRYAGSDLEVVQYSEEIFTSDEVIKRAKNRLGENRYNIFFNNCEHFCYWCKTGRSKCIQLNTIFKDIRSIFPKK